ncbi:MAG: acyltransferase [Breznakibacter sp.]
MLTGQIQMGDEVNLHPSASFNFVKFGNHIKIGKECHLHGSKAHQLEIGDGTIIGMYVMVDGTNAKITIGKNVSIAQQCVIVADWQVVPQSKTAVLFPVKSAPISIGDNTWLGSSCVIAPGVTIGECCIIATNSYVDEDVPSYSVYGGSPAKFIRQLDPSELG